MEIRVKIDREDDLYEKFDADELVLSSGFIHFMTNRLSRKTDLSPATVRFFAPTALDEERFHQALVRYTDEALADNRRQRRRNTANMIYLFAIGIAFIVAGILLNDIGTIYLQIFSLTAGFAIKEAATIFFIKSPQNRLELRQIRDLRRSNFVLEKATQERG